jgi:hypothetical protein
MAFPIAVYGCQLATIPPLSPPQAVQIVTPPSSRVLVGGQPAYSGVLSVVVTGATDPSGNSGLSGSGAITPSQSRVLIEGQPAITYGDSGTVTVAGVNPSGSPVSLPVQVQIISAGQNTVLV